MTIRLPARQLGLPGMQVPRSPSSGSAGRVTPGDTARAETADREFRHPSESFKKAAFLVTYGPPAPPDEGLIAALATSTGIAAGVVRRWLSGECMTGDVRETLLRELWSVFE